MSVGTQPDAASISNQLTQYALQMRDIMQAVSNLSTQVNGGGNGLATLEGYGYSAADASSAQQLIAYMNTVAGCYFGTVQQGGTGGTGASLFNFNQALAGLWNGQ